MAAALESQEIWGEEDVIDEEIMAVSCDARACACMCVSGTRVRWEEEKCG